jgi:hypothetical protein
METTTETRPNAYQLNAHLAAGGWVAVGTYTRTTIYKRRHAGWFSERNGSLYVQSGRRHLCLSHGQALLVAIRTGRVA